MSDMGKLGTIARRSFLIGSACIAGGVVFGVYRYKTPYANPLLDDLVEGEAALTPYVKLDTSGITLITPRADKGQGAYSVQAALLAEELDVALDQIKVDPGPPSAAYWNQALAQEAAAGIVPEKGVVQNIVQTGLEAMVKFAGMQITGGSTTVPDGYVKLRMAGAVARETLKLAASRLHDMPVSKLATQDGTVILPDGRALAYEELASEAARITPVREVTLRPPSAWRLIGKPMQRVDIVEKSTGRLRYGIDLAVEGMVHASVVLNPHQGGAMNGFDATQALKMRGVKAVVPVTGGVGVVADNTWRAIEAGKAITFDWAPASFPDTMEGHWAVLADSFTPERKDAQPRHEGDVEAQLAGSDVIKAEYRAPYLAHQPLEPISAIVRIDEDRATVWTGTQVPRFVQNNVAAIAGLSADDVAVHVQYMGGSFGHRLEDEVVKQAAQIALAMKGVPVKLTYSREEDMIHDFTRQIAMARMQGRVQDGRVNTYDLGIAMPSVVASQMGRQGFSIPGPDSQIVAGAGDQPFAFDHHRVTGYRAPPLAPISSWRSVGASTNGFFYNAGLDELIHAAGADPLEERLRHCEDEMSRKVLEAVREMSDWSGSLGYGKGGAFAPQEEEPLGRGVAFTRSFGVPCAQVIEVRNREDGIKIEHVWVAADVGVVVDPVNFDNLVKGGVIWALGHAMNCEITYSGGIAEQTNFDSYEGMRLPQCPDIHLRALENGQDIKGIGEPPVPPAAPALAAAVFDATGVRLREMPFSKFVDFA